MILEGVTVDGSAAIEVGESEGDLLVVVPAGLKSVFVEFGAESGTELGVGGGSLGETAFLANGGVLFEVAMDAPRARLPAWWSSGRHHYHLLRLSMPGGEAGKRYPFRVHGSPSPS